jgi:Ca2+-binding RTX toxin-like protein
VAPPEKRNSFHSGKSSACLLLRSLELTAVPPLCHSTPPPSPLNGTRGFWTQNTSGVTVLPKGYDDVISSACNAVIVGPGDPDENVLAGSGNLTFVATGGSGTVVTGAGADVIHISSSDTGNRNIQTGSGADTIVDHGMGHDTIDAGAGHNYISLGRGTYEVTSVGNDTVIAGTGGRHHRCLRFDSKSSEVVFGGSGNLDFIGGAGPATLFGGDSSATVEGGLARCMPGAAPQAATC